MSHSLFSRYLTLRSHVLEIYDVNLYVAIEQDVVAPPSRVVFSLIIPGDA